MTISVSCYLTVACNFNNKEPIDKKSDLTISLNQLKSSHLCLLGGTLSKTIPSIRCGSRSSQCISVARSLSIKRTDHHVLLKASCCLRSQLTSWWWLYISVIFVSALLLHLKAKMKIEIVEFPDSTSDNWR